MHTLQLVVTNFSKDWSFPKLVKHVNNALVQKVNKSSKATEKLIQLCSRKLVGRCPAQPDGKWKSTGLTITSLLETKVSLTHIFEDLSRMVYK